MRPFKQNSAAVLVALSCIAAPRLASAGELTADISAVMQRYHIPGATVEIVQDDRVVYAHAFGFSDLALRTPARYGTHYEIGSITKQITAAAVLQLREARKIDLDAKIATYVPDAPHATEITVRQLLTQTSGLVDYLDVPGIVTSKAVTYDQLMSSIAGKPLQFAPGGGWRYSNTNYVILGRIIEVVSNERYDAYVRRHIFSPLGMKQTFTIDDESSIPDMSFGYQLANGHLSPVRGAISGSYGWSAGDIVSTVGDVADWGAALRNGAVITGQDYALMTTSQPTTQGDSGYGFGLFLDAIDDQPRIGHTGGDPGFTAAAEYFPKQNVNIIALTNDGNENGHPEAGEILTTVAYEDMFPQFAATAMRPSADENPVVRAKVRTFFLQLQSGQENYETMAPGLAAKFRARYSALFASEFAPYGIPSAFIFRGRRVEAEKQWFDYVIHFGPGVSLRIAVGFDGAGKVSGLSFD
jgi:D-alanyl-D-alanine carboxypeptidase